MLSGRMWRTLRGLSPFARRNQGRLTVSVSFVGSISARAEEPGRTAPLRCPSWVYLRSRGGTSVLTADTEPASGLSPLARRNLTGSDLFELDVGSISARAEEPSLAKIPYHLLRVYLRSRGGTSAVHVDLTQGQGLSPLARRNRRRFHHRCRNPGSISARAEEPCRSRVASCLRGVYLRSRGGTSSAWSCLPTDEGLSPLARRNLTASGTSSATAGSISARAEEPTRLLETWLCTRVYLRSRGGTGVCLGSEVWILGLSPLARRNQLSSSG